MDCSTGELRAFILIFFLRYPSGVTSGAVGPLPGNAGEPLIAQQFALSTWQIEMFTAINLLGAMFGIG